MSVTAGADPDELDRLAVRFNEVADRITAAQKSLNPRINSSPWHGRNADRFRQRWSGEHRRAIADAVAFLNEGASDLQRNAREQRDASRDGGAGRSPRGREKRIDEPMPFERPHRFWFFTWGEDEMRRVHLHDKPLFEGGVDPSDVYQGSLGDCYLIAAIAALAATESGKATIKNMIADNGDGTFTVTFGDGKRVTVDDWFYADKGGGELYADARSDKWTAILEEAYARRGGSYGAIVGGFPDEAMSDLGVPATRTSMSDLSLTELEEILTSGRPVAVSAELGPSAPIYYSNEGRHAFSVVGTSRDPSGELIVTLRNPWGQNEGLDFPDGVKANRDTGEIQCNLRELKKMTYSLSVAS